MNDTCVKRGDRGVRDITSLLQTRVRASTLAPWAAMSSEYCSNVARSSRRERRGQHTPSIHTTASSGAPNSLSVGRARVGAWQGNHELRAVLSEADIGATREGRGPQPGPGLRARSRPSRHREMQWSGARARRGDGGSSSSPKHRLDRPAQYHDPFLNDVRCGTRTARGAAIGSSPRAERYNVRSGGSLGRESRDDCSRLPALAGLPLLPSTSGTRSIRGFSRVRVSRRTTTAVERGCDSRSRKRGRGGLTKATYFMNEIRRGLRFSLEDSAAGLALSHQEPPGDSSSRRALHRECGDGSRRPEHGRGRVKSRKGMQVATMRRSRERGVQAVLKSSRRLHQGLPLAEASRRRGFGRGNAVSSRVRHRIGSMRGTPNRRSRWE